MLWSRSVKMFVGGVLLLAATSCGSDTTYAGEDSQPTTAQFLEADEVPEGERQTYTPLESGSEITVELDETFVLRASAADDDGLRLMGVQYESISIFCSDLDGFISTTRAAPVSWEAPELEPSVGDTVPTSHVENFRTLAVDGTDSCRDQRGAGEFCGWSISYRVFGSPFDGDNGTDSLRVVARC